MFTQQISSGLYWTLHFKVSLSILAAFLTCQFRALRFLETASSEQNLDSISGNGPNSFLTSSIWIQIRNKNLKISLNHQPFIERKNNDKVGVSYLCLLFFSRNMFHKPISDWIRVHNLGVPFFIP